VFKQVETNRLSGQMSPGLIWFNANRKPPVTPDGHRHCSPTECLSLQVDLADYRPLHINADCHCGFMGPDEHQLARMVVEGSTPLIRFKKDSRKGSRQVEDKRVSP